MKIERTDIHRPSVIQPQDYEFVGIAYDPSARDVVGGDILLADEWARIREHLKNTGGKWASHEHGGTCHCCGASALYLAVFYHQESNEYIKVGETCAEKMRMGESERFASARRSIKNSLEAIAGKRKAKEMLTSLGLSQAWELYAANIYYNGKEENIVCDIVKKLISYGELSDKQISYLKTLLYTVENREKIAAERAAEKEQAAPCPTGRILVTGTIISSKVVEGYYGDQEKMFVKTREGYTLWGSVPRGIKAERGAEITFKATVQPSDKDPKHGYFSRPSAQK